MELRPVKQYQEPTLPTRQIIDECPELLRLVPRRWQANPVVLSALAGVCTLMLGSRVLADKQPAIVSKVAPIFQHGEGYGGFGCIAVNPPVLLSEDEARQVIVDEAKRSGVSFVDTGKTLARVPVPITGRWPFKADIDVQGNYNKQERSYPQPLKLDGVDEKRSIAFEFVSWHDYVQWESPDESKYRLSTAGHYAMLDAAESLRAGLVRTKPQGIYGVFYDPCVGPKDAQKQFNYSPPYNEEGVDWDAEREKQASMAKEIASKELRKQVQDFIKWLKTQGVI